MRRTRRGWFVFSTLIAASIAFTIAGALAYRTMAQVHRARGQLAAEETALLLDSWEHLLLGEKRSGRAIAGRTLVVPGWGRLEASGTKIVARPTDGPPLERPLTD